MHLPKPKLVEMILSKKRKENLTFFNENRQPEVSCLKHSILLFTGEQEILRLEISMNDTHEMTNLNNIHNGPNDPSSSSLRVMSLSYNPIEQLTTRTQLHHQMHRLSILISTLDLDNVGLSGQVLHYLNLSLHILLVLLADQLPLQDGLAGVSVSRGDLSAPVRYPELPSA